MARPGDRTFGTKFGRVYYKGPWFVGYLLALWRRREGTAEGRGGGGRACGPEASTQSMGKARLRLRDLT